MNKLCKNCDKEFYCKPSHFDKKYYCDKACMAEGYKTRLSGVNNPNYKNLPLKKCIKCNNEYFSYDKRRKYCSHECYSSTKLKQKEIKPIKPIKPLVKLSIKIRKPKETLKFKCSCNICKIDFRSQNKTRFCTLHKPQKTLWNCKYCKKEMITVPSAVKQYCSYACHIKSGGAFRAGEASAGMMKKYGAKKDANHVEIVDAFKKLKIHVVDLSTMGQGVPDLIIWCKEKWILVDIKNPKTAYGRRGLNERQKTWANEWKGGGVYLVSSLNDVEAMANGRFDEVKMYP